MRPLPREDSEKGIGSWLDLRLVVAVQATPLQARAGLTSQGGRSAYLVGDTAQPTRDAMHTLGSEDDPGSAAYHGAACKASIAVGESMLGSLRRRLTDL